jgi:membrane-bound lytic murein transglycosylase D
MRQLFFLIICISHNTFSQIDIKTPILKPDIILEYDIALKYNNPAISKKVAKETLYNEDIIKHRIDSLNDLTPLNLVYNQVVAQHIKFYLIQRKDQVSKLLSLAEYYFPIFEKYLDQNELPLELKYLPIIESSLNANARSYAGAVGLWQFMYPTAKEYGLRINSYLDERKDVYKSTQAACSYLSKAYKVFNDWDLALSSYNAGRRNITKAIRRSGGVFNYWELRPFLPKETRNYIPSFIAALYVMNFAAEHGIYKSNENIFASYEIDTVYVKRPIKMSHLAEILQVDTLLLERLNPAYRIKLIPSIKAENFPIVLPYDKVGLFITNEETIYQKLESMELAEKLDYPEFTDIEKIRYKVKSGDYLGKIAKKNQCTVKDIMLWNDLKSHNIKVGQRLNIYKTVK